MTAYLGFDVLETEHNWRGGSPATLRRKSVRFDPLVGTVNVDDQAGVGAIDMTLSWFLKDRTDQDTFNAFVAARNGRAVPFWVPTWRQDLVLASPALSTDTALVIHDQGYTKFQWPNLARRDIALLVPGQAPAYRRITGSTDTGTTETLTLSAATGMALPTGTLISFLLFCRLAEDSVRRVWTARDVADADLGLYEIPKEVP